MNALSVIENLVHENQKIWGIFYLNFVLDFAKKGGKIDEKSLQKGTLQKWKNAHYYKLLVELGAGPWRL
jgi:hypothetical protein